jgi:hypothetical protein
MRSVGLCESESLGDQDQLSKGLGSHFCHNPTSVDFDRLLHQAEQARNLFVGKPISDML